jgi:transposase
LGVSQGAVSQWIKRAREEGEQALGRRMTPGPKPRLTGDQRAQLTQMLARGATAYGFVEDLWTPRRVAEVIRREYGVNYHPDHVRRILNACGWPLEKMVRRAAAK